ncbi:MAG: SBBP repeat-containing protein, partial [Gloeomargarita sp. SKYB31]|nr:SBBP repeat-containing protein [Gloeomargarita sp. SKYB31]
MAAQSTSPLFSAEQPVQGDGVGMMFIENVGQYEPAVRFYAPGGGGAMWLTGEGLWVTIVETAPAAGAGSEESRRGVSVRLSFVGANPNAELVGVGRLETVVNYLIGDDPAQFRRGVPAYAGVRYRDLYPGIDLELVGEGGHLMPRIVARAGANLSAVRLRVEGAEAVELVSGGGDGALALQSESSGLRVVTELGEFVLPLLAIEGGGSASPEVVRSGLQAFEVVNPFTTVGGQSALLSENSSSELLYATVLSDTSSVEDVAVDGSGNVYVTGNAYHPNLNRSQDAFVAKLNSAGSAVYFSFLGGSRSDYGRGIAVDGNGNAYVTGYTSSADFPVTSRAFDTSHNSPRFDT